MRGIMSRKVLTPHHHWTSNEIDFLRRNFPVTPTKLMAEHMKLSVEQVGTAANRNGILKVTSQDIVNFNGIFGKTCGKCRIMKDLDKFHVNNYNKSKLETNCKVCRSRASIKACGCFE